MEIKGQFGKYSEIYREHYKKELIITLCIYTAFSILLLVLFIQSHKVTLLIPIASFLYFSYLNIKRYKKKFFIKYNNIWKKLWKLKSYS